MASAVGASSDSKSWASRVISWTLVFGALDERVGQVVLERDEDPYPVSGDLQ